MLIGLAALALFIFTPAAAELAQSPRFAPILMIGLGGFALWSVAKSLTTGSVEPMVRGARWQFTRAEQPKRFWASIGWNVVLGGVMCAFGAHMLIDVPAQALRDRCHNRKDAWSPKDALAACDRLLVDSSGDDRSGVIASRGSAYYRLGDYRRAGADYAAAIRLDPQRSSSHYNLGLVHEQLGKRERAIADYNAAIDSDPQNVEAFRNRGLIHLDSGRFDRAIADFTRALDLAPTDVMTLANRGISYAWKGDRVRAVQDFGTVRKIDPSNIVLRRGEALLALKNGDLTGGIRLLSEVIAHNPADVWALSMRAEAYRILGDREKMNADIMAARR